MTNQSEVNPLATMSVKQLVIKVKDGVWWATLDGKHLPSDKVLELIAKGISCRFEKEG